MRCMECGAELRKSHDAIDTEFRGERFLIPGIEHYVCDSCGGIEYAADQGDLLTRRIDEEYRRGHGLLPPEEIRRIRMSLGLTQAQFQDLLGVGKTAVSRWETGKLVQGAPEDKLMRMIAEHPCVAQDLMERAELARTGELSAATRVCGSVSAGGVFSGGKTVAMKVVS